MKIIDYYQEIQFEASKDAYKVTCHYLKIKDGKPHPEGSGVFLKIGNEKFLLTAAHVIENQENDIYVGIDKHNLVKLGGELTINSISGSRKKDKLDLAIMKLSTETINKLGDVYEFLDESEIGINHNFKDLPMYQSVGFPATMSKYNRHKDEIKSNPFIYTTMPAESEVYQKLNCETYCNIIVKYDKGKIINYKTKKQQTGPDPFGISGSGLWYIPSQLEVPGKKLDKLLVAIMTEWPVQNRRYWIGTRIDIYTEIIWRKYGLELPQSKIVKVNFN